MYYSYRLKARFNLKGTHACNLYGENNKLIWKESYIQVI